MKLLTCHTPYGESFGPYAPGTKTPSVMNLPLSCTQCPAVQTVLLFADDTTLPEHEPTSPAASTTYRIPDSANATSPQTGDGWEGGFRCAPRAGPANERSRPTAFNLRVAVQNWRERRPVHAEGAPTAYAVVRCGRSLAPRVADTLLMWAMSAAFAEAPYAPSAARVTSEAATSFLIEALCTNRRSQPSKALDPLPTRRCDSASSGCEVQSYQPRRQPYPFAHA